MWRSNSPRIITSVTAPFLASPHPPRETLINRYLAIFRLLPWYSCCYYPMWFFLAGDVWCFFSPILFCLRGCAAFLRFQLWVVLSVAAVCLCQERAVRHEFVFVCAGSFVTETTFCLLVPVVWHWAGQILLLFRLPIARPPTHNASCFCCLSSMVTPVSQHADRCATNRATCFWPQTNTGTSGKISGSLWSPRFWCWLLDYLLKYLAVMLNIV